jgi:hypothetical protein
MSRNNRYISDGSLPLQRHTRILVTFAGCLLLLLFPFCLSSCITEEQYDDTPKGNFEALWKIMDEHYCFFTYKAEQYRLDWGAIQARYRARISDSMTDEQLFGVLSEMLGELRDGHVNLYSSSNTGRNWSWYENYPANFSDSVQRVYLGTDYRLTSGLKYKVLPSNIGYIYCGSFNTTIGDGNLSEILSYLSVCTGLIVDVRGNTGGSLDNAERFARRFTEEKRLVGYISHKTGAGHNDFSTPQPIYMEPARGVRWQKPVVVLTNRLCYSAANDFVKRMHECPNVKVLGDYTGGGSGLPFSSELPNGWGVRFSACPMYDARMNQTEFGIRPDSLMTYTSYDMSHNVDTYIEAAIKILK